MLLDSVTSSDTRSGADFGGEQQESGWVMGRRDFCAKVDVC
jgi:hypothetical protein